MDTERSAERRGGGGLSVLLRPKEEEERGGASSTAVLKDLGTEEKLAFMFALANEGLDIDSGMLSELAFALGVICTETETCSGSRSASWNADAVGEG